MSANRREDAGKSHLAQAVGQAATLQGHKVLYRQTHILLEEVAEATLEGRRKQYMESITSVALLIIDDSGMRRLPQTGAEDLLEIVMRDRGSQSATSCKSSLFSNTCKIRTWCWLVEARLSSIIRPGPPLIVIVCPIPSGFVRATPA